MDIVRTQIYLRKKQHHDLRHEAHRLGISLTELLRRALDAFLHQSQNFKTPAAHGLSSLIGLGESSTRDGALRHDDYVSDIIHDDFKKKRNIVRKRS
jgi:hypothetical protein